MISNVILEILKAFLLQKNMNGRGGHYRPTILIAVTVVAAALVRSVYETIRVSFHTQPSTQLNNTPKIA